MAAITTGMLIAAGISAATNIYTSHQANKANEKALAQQNAASEKGLDIVTAEHEKANAALKPFASYGSAAYQTLGQAMGLSPAGMGGPEAPPVGDARPATPEKEWTGHGIAATVARGMAKGKEMKAAGTLPEQTLGHWAGMADRVANATSSVAKRKMQAPTGEIEEVDEADVPYYSSLGATEVS